MKTFLYILLMLSSAGIASAQNQYWVDPVNGNDANNGLCQSTNSPAGCTGAPWKTIQKATTTSVVIGGTGTTINFLPGNYPIPSSFNSFVSGLSNTQRLTLLSTVKYGAVITMSCPQDSCWMEGGDFITIQNFAFTGPSGGGFELGLDLGNSPFGGCNGLQNPPLGCGFASFDNVLGNRFQDMGNSLSTNSGNCDMSGFFTGNAIHDALIDSNIVNRVGVAGGCTATGGTSSHGIYYAGWFGTITNNQVSNAAGAGIELFHNPCKNVVANNTIYHNYVGGLQVAGFAVNSGQITQCISNDFTSITNNGFFDNGYGKSVGNCASCGHGAYAIQFTSGSGTHNKASNNYLAGNWNSSTQTNNTINLAGSGNPPISSGNTDGGASFASVFTNYQANGSGAYTLAGSSPLIAAGTASIGVCATSPGLTPCAPGTDFTGANRAGTPSIGAFDVVTGTPVGHISPASSSFPTTRVGSCSVPQLVTVSNTGTASYTITPASTVTGTNAVDFPFSGTGSCTTGQVLAAGQQCTVSNQFCPASAGVRAAQLNVLNTAPSGTLVAAFSGTATQPALAPISPLSFPGQNIGTTSTPMNLAVSNTGTATLNVSGRVFSGPFSASGNGTCGAVPFALVAGANCSFPVVVAPLTLGALSGSVALTHDAPGSPTTISLSGTGTQPGGSFLPTSFSFPSQTINTSSSSQPVVWTNNGTGPTTITAVSIAGNFSQTSTLGALPVTVPSGNSITFSVVCTPTVIGAVNGQLTITDNAPSPTQIATLSGIGQAVASNGILIKGATGVQFTGGVRLLQPN